MCEMTVLSQGRRRESLKLTNPRLPGKYVGSPELALATPYMSMAAVSPKQKPHHAGETLSRPPFSSEGTRSVSSSSGSS